MQLKQHTLLDGSGAAIKVAASGESLGGGESLGDGESLGGGEVVAGVQQAGDDDLQGGDGLGAVAAAVVLGDDGASLGVMHDVADDRGYPGACPVSRVDGPVEWRHAGLHAVPENSPGPRTVRGAEHMRGDTCRVMDRRGGTVHLVDDFWPGQQRQVEVAPG